MWKRHVEREKVEETTSSSNKKYSTERLVDEQRKLSCVELGSTFDDKHALPSMTFSFFSGLSAAYVHKPPDDKIIYQINLKQTEINLKTNLKSISRQTKLIPKQTQIRPV